MKDYAAIATQYARDVVARKRDECSWVRLACNRHLKDLARAERGWDYIWNPLLSLRDGRKYRPADRACYFVELLPHVKGTWAAKGELLRLEPWQVFFVASVFGWVDRETGRRRFRAADLFVPRKNTKSTLAAAIGLYMLAVDEEYGAEVYSGATSKKQAHEVFAPARAMTLKTPALRARWGIEPRASNINVVSSMSKFEPVIRNPGDGASPHCAIIDEYHEHDTDALYDTMKTGMGARAQPLMLVITTAGVNTAGPCYAHQEQLQAVLSGTVKDEQRFGLIYTIDLPDEKHGVPGDDWTSEAALRKANPNCDVSVSSEYLKAQLAEALRDPRKQATYQTKHLNLWVSAANPWLNLHQVKLCVDSRLQLKSFKGESCVSGLDLSSTTDISSLVKVFSRDVAGKRHYYAFWRHYLPETRINAPENKHYQGWRKAGWLIETAGSMIDQEAIRNGVLADQKHYHATEVALDAWGSPGISAALANDGLAVVLVPMNVAHLSAPMKFIDGLVADGRLHFNDDPVALWGLSNVSVKMDHNGNVFPRRPKEAAKKIDPAVALIIAMSRAMLGEQVAQDFNAWLASDVPARGRGVAA